VEFLVEFELNVPKGSNESEVTSRNQAEASAAAPKDPEIEMFDRLGEGTVTEVGSALAAKAKRRTPVDRTNGVAAGT
jgi:hypothetical protein